MGVGVEGGEESRVKGEGNNTEGGGGDVLFIFQKIIEAYA